MLQKNKNRITVVLVYVVLEWILIFFLLLNSFFSYLIGKFAKYCGLKRPCLLCSRVDHIFLEPDNCLNSFRDLVCDAHAMEISQLSYCARHQKLIESRHMCRDCSSSQPEPSIMSLDSSPRIAYFTWVSENIIANVGKNVKCTCCDGNMTSSALFSLQLLKPYWGVLDCLKKDNLISVSTGENNSGDEKSGLFHSDCSSDHGSKTDGLREGEGERYGERVVDEGLLLSNVVGSFSLGAAAAAEEEDSSRSFLNSQRDIKESECEKESFSRQGTEDNAKTQMSCKDDELLRAIDLHSKRSDYCTSDRLIPIEFIRLSTVGSPAPVPFVENLVGGENKREQVDCEIQSESLNKFLEEEADTVAELPCLHENQFSVGSSNTTNTEKDQGLKQFNKSSGQERTALEGHDIEVINQHLEPNDADEEKMPAGPTYMDGLQHLYKKLVLFDKKDTRTESWDGSVRSEVEGDGGGLTIERLNAALKAQRKALSALYAELEEERTAAAIAANQTMAMITRLQEEKAAMQMEALQYQRMMEEQSEYDQEALQLVNELMVKREKEKQELEKELEIYRKKVLDNEEKEKTAMVRRNSGNVRRRNSSVFPSNIDDRDDPSTDFNCEDRGSGSGFDANQENRNKDTPSDAATDFEEMEVDCLKHFSTLDESLTEFEEERLPILEELKALEVKLFTLADDDDEENLSAEIKPRSSSAEDDDKEIDENYGFSSPDGDGVFADTSGKHYLLRKSMDSKPTRLLPLLNATGNDELNEEEEIIEPHSTEARIKMIAIAEEVDHVYERLQALEADSEFLKHCLSSLRKGDKGMELLQEILLHLQDLRSVEFRARNIDDDLIQHDLYLPAN